MSEPSTERNLDHEKRVLSQALRDVERARSTIERALREVDLLRARTRAPEEPRWSPPDAEWDYPIW